MAQPQTSFMEQLLKPLFDRIGLNGQAALVASHKPDQQKSQPKIDPEQLRRQGWSDKDIEYVLRRAQGTQR